MKKTAIIVAFVYLSVSIGVCYLYKSQSKDSSVAIEAQVSVESDYDGEAGKNEEEEKDELQLMSVPTKPLSVVLTTTSSATPPLIPTPTPGIVAEPAGEPAGKPSTELVTEPTQGVSVSVTQEPDLTMIPTQEEEQREDTRAVVKYNGKEILYSNTSYRMGEETLEKIVSMVRKEPYVSSFVLYDINTEATISYNENRYYPVASTVKAPFVLTCLWQIEEGSYSLEDTMEYVEEYKVKGDGAIKNEELGKVYTIKELMEHAIKISDDIGYLMLQGFFGHEEYNRFLKESGNRVSIDGKNVKWGQTSAIDSLRNWQEIYRYIHSEKDHAVFFAELLKSTNKSFVRNVLGDEYEVYNKMGWVRNQCCHDHAIVMDEEPYILIIMTMGDVGKENQKFMEEMAVILNAVHDEMLEMPLETE